ncbi:MAG: hypothetical protein QHC78_07890 [Pigmentiphaga sp.]|uniref:hypothetical protein n=1 Tax=Pigmentiphaga sp. TaxID=1977564 RepID=UPI0029A4FA6C|nr:hypothetical protein [Pigmentiphaga sp.]MDX3905594.1 hypothetical protein [Pigmentiphaga sp.]
MWSAAPAADDADLIEGVRTNQFMNALPQDVDGLQLKSVRTDPKQGKVTAEYIDANKTRKAQILVIRIPKGVDGDTHRDKTLSNFAAFIKKEGSPYVERRNYESPSGVEVSCVDAMQNKKLLHSFCSTVQKGRLISIQPLTVAPEKVDARAYEYSNAFVGKIVDSVEKM